MIYEKRKQWVSYWAMENLKDKFMDVLSMKFRSKEDMANKLVAVAEGMNRYDYRKKEMTMHQIITRMKEIRDRINDIVYPGGCANKVVLTPEQNDHIGALSDEYEQLAKLKKRHQDEAISKRA